MSDKDINVPNKCWDTISRQAAIDAIFSEPLYKTGMKKRDADAVVPAIYEKIKSLPSAQPEIIMCKDCIHSPAADDNCPLPVQYIVPEGYCHLGEKKDEQSKV